MKTILIDTTVSKRATISFFENKKLVEKLTGDEPLPLVKELMTKHHLELADTEFELINEKGSYTGLRIGASIVNTLSFVKGTKKLVFPEY